MEDTLKQNDQDTSSTPQDITAHVSTSPEKEYIENKQNPEDLDVTWCRLKCLKCGYVYEGTAQLKQCPKCGNNNPDMFADLD